MADGGEGTMDALLATLEGELRDGRGQRPAGQPGAGRVRAAGRRHAPRSWSAPRPAAWAWCPRRSIDAVAASTRGTGELIVAACEAGAETVLVGVGGSATTDGGAGAVSAVNEAGVRPKLEVVCDVRTPFEDAPRVFAPQKGASPEQVEELE